MRCPITLTWECSQEYVAKLVFDAERWQLEARREARVETMPGELAKFPI